MARKLRIEYAGAIYHLMNRGERREPIFRDDRDRRRFLQTLGQTCQKTGWQIHAFCLMPNHIHLVAETPQANLVAGMKWLLGTYTMRFNRRLTGHLFAGRYKSMVVDGSGTGYLRSVCDYVHFNPVRAKMLKPGQPLKDYPWSSYPAYVRSPRQRPSWLRVDRWLGEHGIRQDSVAGRRELGWRMEERRRQELGFACKAMRRGWYLGNEQFRKELLEQMKGKLGAHHSGPERQASAEAHALGLIRQELHRLGCTATQLMRQSGRAQTKLALADKLREQPTMPVWWIAQQLGYRSWKYLNNELYLRRKGVT